MQELVKIFEKTIEDNALSRSEKKAIGQIIKEKGLNRQDRDFLRSKIFDIAREKMKGLENETLLDWLEIANKLLLDKDEKSSSDSKVYFTPGDDALNSILAKIGGALNVIKICVFTISDNVIASKLVECHKKGVHIKIITDNDKCYDKGSDIAYLADAGIPVRIDNTPHHMHNKFAVIDNKTVITGSYNWTRSAKLYNQENIVITNEESIVKPYIQEFDKLWERMEDYK